MLLQTTCNKFGLEPLAPSDGLVPPWAPEAELPQRIYATNMGLLQQADGVIANLAPFRGVEPDSGTVLEVGVAVAPWLAGRRLRHTARQLCRQSEGRHAHDPWR